nr:hypothetical protein CFP56_00034 [Quercus suber]
MIHANATLKSLISHSSPSLKFLETLSPQYLHLLLMADTEEVLENRLPRSKKVKKKPKFKSIKKIIASDGFRIDPDLAFNGCVEAAAEDDDPVLTTEHPVLADTNAESESRGGIERGLTALIKNLEEQMACITDLIRFLEVDGSTKNEMDLVIMRLCDLLKNENDVCKEVVCGKGTCKPSNQSAFFLFECECDPGWKQANFGLAQNFKFLPCVVPNCTINYSCMNASSPVQDKGSRANESILDPCHWTDCGGGFCNKTSNLTYSCECAKDYYNILNDTSLPCFQDCAIGMDCSNLGISSSNKSTSTTQVSSDDATSTLQGHYHWLITLMTFMAMVQWK